MRQFTKRWRKAMRRTWRKNRATALRVVGKLPTTNGEIDRYNRCAKYLNRLVRYPAEKGHAIADGEIECPKCGRGVTTYADPQEWQRRRQPKWRKDDGKAWQVTDYWAGIAECCGLILAFQPDGRAECYSLNEKLTNRPSK